MASYANLQAAIDAGETNMAVLRDNSKNDDSSVDYPIGVSWFRYMGQVVEDITSSGNGWLGFESSEALKVNYQSSSSSTYTDGAVYYEYKETGTIGGTNFIKFRWKGVSRYNQPYGASGYNMSFDVFILDTSMETIYLRWYEVPTNYFGGYCSLSVSDIQASSGTPFECYWVAGAADGTSWGNAVLGRPSLSPSPGPSPTPSPAVNPDIIYSFDSDKRYGVLLRSYYTVLGSNTVKHKDSKIIPFTKNPVVTAWFNMRTPIDIQDEQGNTLNIRSVEIHDNGAKKYNVYKNASDIPVLIVANDSDIDYPSEYRTIPKWLAVLRDNT